MTQVNMTLTIQWPGMGKESLVTLSSNSGLTYKNIKTEKEKKKDIYEQVSDSSEVNKIKNK